MSEQKPTAAETAKKAALEEARKSWEIIQLPLPGGHTRIIKRKRQPRKK